MRKLLCLFIPLLVVLVSCESNSTAVRVADSFFEAEGQQEIRNLNEHLRKYESPSQFYSISSENPAEVQGNKGTVISVNPADLETLSGHILGNEIKIELRELTDQAELLRTRAQTVSNSQLLVSGGAYYVAMTSNGENLKLKQGKTLKVVFPKYAKEEMALFYGQRDSLGLMNWKESNKLLSSVARNSDIPEGLDFDTALGDELEVYQAIGISSLGWINCDRFLEIEEKADLWVKVNATDSASAAKVFLVFKDINSVMEGYLCGTKSEGDSTLVFEGIPVGYKARLIAYTQRGGKEYAHVSDVVVGQSQVVGLQFKPVAEQELNLLFSERREQ